MGAAGKSLHTQYPKRWDVPALLLLAAATLVAGYLLMGAPVWIGGSQVSTTIHDEVTGERWMKLPMPKKETVDTLAAARTPPAPR